MKTLLLTLFFLLLAARHSFAADWNFYGSARISAFYEKIDDNLWQGLADTQSYAQKLHGNSRIGARVTVSDELNGRFEYGATGGGANLRLLYGEWHFGAGKLLIGQAYTPLLSGTGQVYNFSPLNRGDTSAAYWGGVYAGRKAQIGLKIGRLYLAAVEQEAELYDTGSGTTELTLPELHLNYTFSNKTWMAQLLGGLAAFDVEEAGSSGDVTSYLAGAHGRLRLGRAYLTGGGWFGRNAGNLIQQYVSLADSGQHFAKWDGTGVIDNDSAGFFASAGYVLNNMFRFEAGYGYCRSELDTAASVEYEAATCYLQSAITLAPGVTVVPEIGRIDMSEGPAFGNMDITYAGMKWQINF